MDEKPENDSQEVQPDPKEQSGDEAEVSPEVEELQKEIAKKDERIADLSSKQRELKKEAKEAKKSDETTTKKSDELDYGQLAYLNSLGVQDSEIEFVQDELKKSGEELKTLWGNEYFQAKLKSHRDAILVKDATPSNTRSGGEAPSSKADYWMARDEMPENTPANTKLRREIVQKRMDSSRHASQFTSNPIISG